QPGPNPTHASGKPAALDQVESFSQFSYDLRQLEEIIAVVCVPYDDESAGRRGYSAHQCAAIAWFVDGYHARSLALGDSLGQIGAPIVRHQNLTSDVMLAQSSSSFLNARRQSILLIKAGNDY